MGTYFIQGDELKTIDDIFLPDIRDDYADRPNDFSIEIIESFLRDTVLALEERWKKVATKYAAIQVQLVRD